MPATSWAGRSSVFASAHARAGSSSGAARSPRNPAASSGVVTRMAKTAFAVTWDYRCPFARNAHEHVAVGLRAWAPWDVTFAPFSLSQVHVPEGGTPVWEDPDKARDLLAMLAGIVARDQYPDQFLSVH